MGCLLGRPGLGETDFRLLTAFPCTAIYSAVGIHCMALTCWREPGTAVSLLFVTIVVALRIVSFVPIDASLVTGLFEMNTLG
jgi:hypothetical protein